MVLEKLLQFDPAGTAITATAPSSNAFDMNIARDMGLGAAGGPSLEAVITVGTTFAAAGLATLQIQFQGSTDNLAWTTYWQTDAIPKANLTVGQVIRLPLPPQAAAPHAAGIARYYRLNYVVATGPFTSGAIEADLVMNPQASMPPTYPSGFVVNN
jgi:Bbp16-like protein